MSVRQYWANSNECLEWAQTARSDREREIFMQMASAWREAAVASEAVANLRDIIPATEKERHSGKFALPGL
jgi:hypothetical protein